MSTKLNWRTALAKHWPEYLIEAAALALFMLSACIVDVLLEYPNSPLHIALPDPVVRRMLCGIAMGVVAVCLICSPWGQRSGAHMNPAVTLAFLSLAKVSPWDAFFYIIAQFTGALTGNHRLLAPGLIPARCRRQLRGYCSRARRNLAGRLRRGWYFVCPHAGVTCQFELHQVPKAHTVPRRTIDRSLRYP